MRDSDKLKKENAEVYYRDVAGGSYGFVKGQVLESKSVKDANKEWKQRWNRTGGTILKIAPQSKTKDKKVKYRHLSSVLSPEQYKERKERARTTSTEDGKSQSTSKETNRKRSGTRTSGRKKSSA